MDKVNIHAKLAAFDDHWAPRTIARCNDSEVRLMKLDGDFAWHRRADADELLLVIDGRLDIEFQERTVQLRAGELVVVPRGAEHRPRALHGEGSVLLVAPAMARVAVEA